MSTPAAFTSFDTLLCRLRLLYTQTDRMKCLQQQFNSTWHSSLSFSGWPLPGHM